MHTFGDQRMNQPLRVDLFLLLGEKQDQ